MTGRKASAPIAGSWTMGPPYIMGVPTHAIDLLAEVRAHGANFPG